MKTNGGVVKYASQQDYLNKTGTLAKKAAESSLGTVKSAKDVASNVPGIGPDSKVEVSNEAKKLGEDVKEGAKKIGKKVTDKAKEGGSAGNHLIGEAASTLSRAFKTIPGIGKVPLPKGDEVAGAKAVSVHVPKTINKPAIFFVSGFELNPFDEGENGLPGMSGAIPSSETFNWNDEDSMIDEIRKRPRGQPIILVGHGMGGDTVVNIANRLNTTEFAFRKVNLAVTMDSIGFENDIIPQNVERNLNFISDEDYFFNDGPNIARNKDLTRVVNELRAETHSEIETSPEVQFQVFETINSILGEAVTKRNHETARMKSVIDNLKSENQA
jgi:pimeloyl-ACP methyl ester carboxylesterase